MEILSLRDKLIPDSANLVPAAVLIPLIVPQNNAESSDLISLKTREGHIDLPLATQVVLTERTHTVEHHKGQISFPGGVFEPQDSSLEETALRETFEEIGLARECVQVVAELPDIPTIASKFRVRPFVGVVREQPEFQPSPHEIGKILMVPLRHLLDPANSVLESHERNGVRYQIKAYHYESHRIWGATGLMLQVFLEKFIQKR